MKHVWSAIELCHLKLLSECDRLESARAVAARVEAASRSGAPATIERAADALTEAQAELRAIIAARQAFKDLYGDPTDEENKQHA
jgi:hypothetical protein